ncbi:MAG: 3'(2'),5'-bisphosphate nucleotidase CysQ [Deltaproteobacteria bacterium]|nr:MAG: 3'(2'),5'-bisphosphate nucleotidase CysQ [Deltaproteobacteria bacterium]
MHKERDVAVRAATAASAAIHEIWRRDDAWVTDKDQGKGPLTEADLAADAILQDHLRTAFPDDGILSEESVDAPDRLGKRRVWILDPLDGTREFVDRVPEFVVSVGLVVEGRPVLGVLVHPVRGQVIVGIVGEGAWLDGAPVRTTDRSSLEGGRIVVSRSELRKGMFDAWQGLAHLEPVGSVAYKMGLVGIGQADATFTPRPRSEWDVAGATAIVLAAGGRVTGTSGQPYRFNQPKPLVNGVVVSNGLLHDELLALARRGG